MDNPDRAGAGQDPDCTDPHNGDPHSGDLHSGDPLSGDLNAAGLRASDPGSADRGSANRGSAARDSADRDSADRDGRLAEQLLRLNRRLHRIQKSRLEPVGITPAQGRLLRTVAHCVAHRGGPPRMADLAASLEVVPRAVTTLVDGLEGNGWVRRAPDPTNRRVIRIELTDSGRDTLLALRTARHSAAEEVLAPLSGAQRETLGDLLSALTDGPYPPASASERASASDNASESTSGSASAPEPAPGSAHDAPARRTGQDLRG